MKSCGVRWLFSAKKMIFGGEGRSIITNTAQEVARVAAVTLGPMGRNVVIENDKHLPRITKDGVTVVKHIEYADRFQDAICTLIKQSVSSTNKFAGDGTTTSSLLIGELLKETRKYLEAGYQPRQIKRGLIIGRDLGLQFLKMVAQSISNEADFYKVAMIATKGDTNLSILISEALSKSELVKVERTQRTQSYAEYLQGVKIVSGIPHPEFKNVGDKVELDYPLVLLSRKNIDSIEQVVGLLELAKKARKQLLLVSPKISDSVLSTLIYNKRKKIVQVFPVVLHTYGSTNQEYLHQLSKATGAVIFDQYGPCKMESVGFEHLGTATRVEMDEFQTVVYGKADKTISNAVIYAGASTQAVALQVYDKAVDALNSVQTARKSGVVAGGGVTYWRMAEMLDNYQGTNAIGVKILANALRQPRRALVRALPDSYKALGGSDWQGYDFRSSQLEDMFEVGIIDSAAVGENVLIDSISLVHTLVDIEVSILRTSRNVESNEQVNKIQETYRL